MAGRQEAVFVLSPPKRTISLLEQMHWLTHLCINAHLPDSIFIQSNSIYRGQNALLNAREKEDREAMRKYTLQAHGNNEHREPLVFRGAPSPTLAKIHRVCRECNRRVDSTQNPANLNVAEYMRDD